MDNVLVVTQDLKLVKEIVLRLYLHQVVVNSILMEVVKNVDKEVIFLKEHVLQ